MLLALPIVTLHCVKIPVDGGSMLLAAPVCPFVKLGGQPVDAVPVNVKGHRRCVLLNHRPALTLLSAGDIISFPVPGPFVETHSPTRRGNGLPQCGPVSSPTYPPPLPLSVCPDDNWLRCTCTALNRSPRSSRTYQCPPGRSW